jgi:hypothetical protein
MNPRHMMAWSSPRPLDRAHRHHLEQARANGFLQGAEPGPAGLVRHPLDPALDAQHAGYGEPADVGVEHTDRQSPLGQLRGQVGRDRRLAHSALARGDGNDTGGGRDVGVERVVPCLPPGPGHDVLLLFRGHLAEVDRRRRDTGQARHAQLDVFHDLGSQRAAGRGQGDGDIHVAVLRADLDDLHHAQVDDVVAQLRVDHPEQDIADGFLSHRVGRHARPYPVRP